jgi:hypothetical protein
LIDQVRKLRRIDLGEFQFPLGELAHHFFSDGRANACRSMIHELGYFRHDRNLAKELSGQKAKFSIF